MQKNINHNNNSLLRTAAIASCNQKAQCQSDTVWRDGSVRLVKIQGKIHPIISHVGTVEV